MRRRTFLATGATLLVGALAGCSRPASSLRMTAVTDAELLDRVSAGGDELSDRDRELVAETVADGTATRVGRHPPFHRDLPVEYESSFYAVSWAETGERPGTAVTVEVDYDGDASGRRTVAYEALSERDRSLLSGLFPPRTERREDEGYDVGVGGTYTETERERSVLVDGGYEAVRYDGTAYPTAVETDPTTLTVYRYEATEIAADREALLDRVRTDHRFVLDDLSSAERDVVETAVEDGYSSDSESAGFESLLDRFREESPVDSHGREGTVDAEYLVRYRDETYWADLHYDPERLTTAA
ncbi:hypothetical protein [Halomarina oriensis]|uniref:Uncharacterized protein n=1 Tax=Halomarina oriensis TaxID=671145 RepID=A0A6B0GHQ4_9EURY|nr:hypothetical protein [Halomarina oriensis]MWG34392.1 hypothetical protein [Halomarina oriensis]